MEYCFTKEKSIIFKISHYKALKIFEINENDIKFSSIKNNNFLEQGKKFNKIGILFKKIEK